MLSKCKDSKTLKVNSVPNFEFLFLVFSKLYLYIREISTWSQLGAVTRVHWLVRQCAELLFSPFWLGSFIRSLCNFRRARLSSLISSTNRRISWLLAKLVSSMGCYAGILGKLEVYSATRRVTLASTNFAFLQLFRSFLHHVLALPLSLNCCMSTFSHQLWA